MAGVVGTPVWLQTGTTSGVLSRRYRLRAGSRSPHLCGCHTIRAFPRMLLAIALLSSNSSCSIARGDTFSASLSLMRDRLWISPIECTVRLPSLRTRSARGSGCRKDLVGVFVEHQMVVAKMRARHMPVKILGLDVKRERIGDELIHRGCNLGATIVTEIVRGIQRRDVGVGSKARGAGHVSKLL